MHVTTVGASRPRYSLFAIRTNDVRRGRIANCELRTPKAAS